MSKSSQKRKRSAAKNRNSTKLHARRSLAGQLKAKPRPVFEWWERRGTAVFSEDRGPGTARHIRDCTSVTEAEREVRTNNDSYNAEVERLIKTKWAKKAIGLSDDELEFGYDELLETQQNADIHQHAKQEAYNREIGRRRFWESRDWSNP